MNAPSPEAPGDHARPSDMARAAGYLARAKVGTLGP